MLSAQTPARPLTLGESLQLAVANSAQIKKSKLDREALELRFREGRSAAYPQVNAGLNFDYYPVLPTQLLPGELFGQSDGTYIPVQFGRPWQVTGVVDIQQTVFDESLRRGIPAANVSRAIADLLTERAEDELRYNTAQLFYQALQTEALLRSMNANLEKLTSLQKFAQLQLDNGYIIPIDVKRLRVARTNLETQRQNLLTAIGALHQTLQMLSGIPFEQAIQPVGDLNDPMADSAQWLALKLEPEASTENRLLLRNLEFNRIQERSLIAEGFPSLSAYAKTYTQTLREDANLFDTNTRWYGMVVIGFKLKVPVFDGFRKRNKAGLLRVENQKLELDRTQVAAAKALEFRQAREQVQSSIAGVYNQLGNVALAREIADKLMLQYQGGNTPLSDLLSAQTAGTEAETNYWQAVFTYKLSALKLLKTAGKMRELQ